MNVYIYLRFEGNSRLVTVNYKKALRKNYTIIKKNILLKNPEDICIINQIYETVLYIIMFPSNLLCYDLVLYFND